MATENSPYPNSSSSGGSSPWVKKLLIILAVLFFFALLSCGGLVYFIFYKIKESQPAKLSVQYVQQSPVVHDALGDIEKTGWPIGSMSVEGGGSGEASFSFKVKGTKTEGKAYTTLQRVNGQWNIQSARLELKDGASLNLPPSAPTPSASSQSEGRQLKADPTAVANWRSVEWPGQGLSFQVPADWKELKLDKKEIEFRPEDRSAYFIGNVSYFDQKIPFQPLLQSDLQTKHNKLKREEILGYALRPIGNWQGILEIQGSSGGGTMASWTGYVDTTEYGTVSITFLLGSTSLGNFDQVEPVLGAILNSIK